MKYHRYYSLCQICSKNGYFNLLISLKINSWHFFTVNHKNVNYAPARSVLFDKFRVKAVYFKLQNEKLLLVRSRDHQCACLPVRRWRWWMNVIVVINHNYNFTLKFTTTVTTFLQPVYRWTCVSWHLRHLEDFVGAKLMAVSAFGLGRRRWSSQ